MLSVASSAQDLGGNKTAPMALIVISVIASLAFAIMVVARLWKTQKTTAIFFLVSSLINLVYISASIKILNLVLFIWVIALLWEMGKFEKNIKIPEIGKEISWENIINHAFRVFDFDRNGTTVNERNQVKARSSFRPYGYLLVESQILNNRVKLPIIHRDDFLLAASVFDDPKLVGFIESEELIVTYSPKYLGPMGTSGSPHHVLHYALASSGTLDSYYSVNNSAHMAEPDPQKLFGPFVYDGEISVRIDSELNR